MINPLRSIVKNTFVLTFGQFAAKIFNVVFIALLARAVGPSGVGKYAFAVSLIAVFMMLPNFGFDILLVREVSRYRERAKKYTLSVLNIKFVLGITSAILVIAFALWRHYDYQKLQIILIVLVSAVFTSFLSTFFSLFRAFEKMEYQAGLILFNSILRVLFGVAAIKIGLHLPGVLLVVLSADVLTLSAGTIFIRKNFMIFELKGDLQIIKQILRYSLPFGVLSLIDVIFQNTDNLMIARLVNETAVGWYAASNRILLFFLIIPNMFMHAIFPVLSKFYVSNKETLRHTYAKSCSYMLIMAFPLAVGGFLVSDQVILSIYGEQFRNTISVFRVMVWITMFNFVGYVNGATLNATGKEKMFAFMTGCATISNIFLNYIFITKFGYLGACYSTLLLTFLGFVIYSAICHKRLNVKPEWQVIAKSMLAVLIMACVVFLLQKTPLNVFIVIPLGGISYFVMIFLLRIIPKEDAAAIMSVFKRYDKIQVDAGQSLTDR